MAQKLDISVILCLDGPATEGLIERYQSVGRQLIIVCAEDHSICSTDHAVISYDPSVGKVAAINTAILQANKSHVLWLEEGESIPDIAVLEENTYSSAQISNTAADRPIQNRQIRLFPNGDTLKLNGFAIPDMFDAVERLNWKESSQQINIDRSRALFPVEAIGEEVEHGSNSPMYLFWQGMWAMEKQKYTRAIDLFKKTLDCADLPEWNTLAALNSLANSYIETHQLQEAVITAEQSLGKSHRQRAPYLTLYQAYNFKGETDKAYDTLARYSRAASNSTDANWDVYLPQEQAAFLMAEIALKQGKHQKAYRHYQQFYVFSDGQVSEEILEKLFLYAIELQDRDKAVQYFEALFAGQEPGEMNDSRTVQMREALSLFADKGWYDYASKIYRQLVKGQPEDEALRNGLIRTLVKNNEISKAQALL